MSESVSEKLERKKGRVAPGSGRLTRSCVAVRRVRRVCRNPSVMDSESERARASYRPARVRAAGAARGVRISDCHTVDSRYKSTTTTRGARYGSTRQKYTHIAHRWDLFYLAQGQRSAPAAPLRAAAPPRRPKSPDQDQRLGRRRAPRRWPPAARCVRPCAAPRPSQRAPPQLQLIKVDNRD
jgi:hypothetical protein